MKIADKVSIWKNKPFDKETINKIIELEKNEDELIEIFQYIHPEDWVFSAWRNHYHALLHGFDRDELEASIVEGRSMATSSNVNKFYSEISKTKYSIVRHSNIYGPYDKFDLEKGHFSNSWKKNSTMADHSSLTGIVIIIFLLGDFI